jgi:valyl-tRNA synthetase
MADKGFDRFFPTSCLVTGFDIIFFWVARMMMMGLQETKQVPFKHIYIHAIVRDKLGRKMSKSLGNGIDPLEMIDTYGADAFRFTLAAGSGYNRGLNLDPERIGGYRNFINKIWNAFRFIHPFMEEAPGTIESIENLSHHERWILSELNTLAKVVNESMDEYRYDDACQAIYAFVYERFCSWFIELSKKVLYGENETDKSRRIRVLKVAFKKILALLHPFSPYITEELWMYVKNDSDDLLIVTEYPEHNPAYDFPEDQTQMSAFIEVVTQIRNVRASVGIKPKDKVAVQFFSDHQELTTYFQQQELGFSELAKVDKIDFLPKSEIRPGKSAMGATPHTEIFIPLEGVIDITEQVARLEKDLAKNTSVWEKFNKKLSNPNFVANAKPEVVHDNQEKAQAMKDKIDAIEKSLQLFKN